ncbi:MAG: ankyrin repeat domain-containing protein, partial [Myxococcaceae bacterium]
SERVELLIQNGADINAKDEDGNGPLWHAAEQNNQKIVKMLLEKGANLNISQHGIPLLFTVLIKGNFSVARLLIEKGAKINQKFYNFIDSQADETIENWASRNNSANITYFLSRMKEAKKTKHLDTELLLLERHAKDPTIHENTYAWYDFAMKETKLFGLDPEDLYSPMATEKMFQALLIHLVSIHDPKSVTGLQNIFLQDLDLIDLRENYKKILSKRIESAISSFSEISPTEKEALLMKSLNPQDPVYKRQAQLLMNELLGNSERKSDLDPILENLQDVLAPSLNIYGSDAKIFIRHTLKSNFFAKLESKEINSPRDLPVFFRDEFDNLSKLTPKELSKKWDKMLQDYEEKENFKLKPVLPQTGRQTKLS